MPISREARNRIWLPLCILFLVYLSSAWLAGFGFELLALWPSFTALVIVVATRRAFLGLFAGAYSGAVLLSGGSFGGGLWQLIDGQFFPIFTSSWKLSALLFTLTLGGFVGLIEAAGGLQSLLRKVLHKGEASAKRMQFTVLGFGLLVFFDGLANTMLIGRLLRSAADRYGVSREKLAYLADSTGSAVACVAFVSTWIAFQLSMIREGLAAVGVEASAYALFLRSLPTNFYCWFTLLLAVICIVREFNPGPMGKVERAARQTRPPTIEDDSSAVERNAHWLSAIIPICVLTVSIPVISYCIGVSGDLLPFSLERFASAYAEAEKYVPEILVLSGFVASIAATVALWLQHRTVVASKPKASIVFISGVRELMNPVFILIAAWMLGAAINQLGAASLLSGLLEGSLPIAFLPVAIFGLGALISFSTGTSWGTMGVLMPIAIPVIYNLSGDMIDMDRERLVIAAIGAVFSGAVFGDHCSPFSDTTIVASIASGIEPIDHVKTQLPFAIIAAVVAACFGFIPLGFGISAWVCLLVGGLILFLIPHIWRRFSHDSY
jgi:Na+/H+ antiporter NhaC